MHIFGIVLGLIVLAMLGYGLYGVLMRFRSASSILREEMEDRALREQRMKENMQRVRERGIQRLRSVLSSVSDMNNSLPEAQRFLIESDDDYIMLVLEQGMIKITYQIASFSVDGSSSEVQDDMARYERFHIQVLDKTDNRVLRDRESVTTEEAIRLVAREIAAMLDTREEV